MDYTLESMYGIKDETIIVTGASSGIGAEIAKGLLSLGANVVLCGLHQDHLDEVTGGLGEFKDSMMTVKIDVTKEDEAHAMAASVIKRFGKIDGLVNSAGVTFLEDQENFDMENFRWVVEVNLFGTFNCCKAAGLQMLDKKKGRIVNFSSVRGLQGKAKMGAYAASKGAINTYTKSLAVEWATRGINVNAIAPIFTLTNINKSLLANKETYDWVMSRMPKGALSQTSYLVGPTVFLLSKSSEFITGEIMYVDGGWTAG